MTFSDLQLLPEIQEALREKGYVQPTPVQEQTIPAVMQGRDVLSLAQTGTGKTAAFALPILHVLATTPQVKGCRVLVLAPTRELAIQIHDNFSAYGKKLPYKMALLYGGVGQQAQEQALKRHPSIIIATPGRLLDLYSQGHLRLDYIDMLVLDECDRMLDMGFSRDLNKILGLLPEDRQTLLFSATMPQDIASIAEKHMHNPVRVQIVTDESNLPKIRQRMYYVNRDKRQGLLLDVLEQEPAAQALIFTRTKRGADRLSKVLTKEGHPAQAIHGDKSQSQREKALQAFKGGRLKILVATDLASRGIDVKELDLVINYEMPDEAETYVHRIGRTGRAGREGVSVSFRGFDDGDVEKELIRKYGPELEIIRKHSFLPDGVLIAPDPAHAPKNRASYGKGRPTQKAAAPARKPGRR
ncbi:MAG: DEAD/DEAH box helicase [Bacteroidia bacterium]|nr:DEAD/DEAH box helicase [Bacteroidia bacterium]